MRKTYLIILLVLALGIGIVTVLYLRQPKPVKNGFNRGRIYTAKKLEELELKYNYFYINRLDSTRIYLGNYKALLLLFGCNYDLQDSIYERLLYPNESHLKLALLKNEVVKKVDPNGDSFSADGFLNYNPVEGRIIYTYYYHNSFVCLDTNLDELYTATTIDTNSIAKIKLGQYKQGNKTIRTMVKPALAVNKRGYTDGNWFYNHAALAADNESLKVFDKHEVLDVYEINTGRYHHSIYLRKHKGEKLTDFGVYGNLVVALFGRHIIIYKQELD